MQFSTPCMCTLWEVKRGILAGTEGAEGTAAAPNQWGKLADQ